MSNSNKSRLSIKRPLVAAAVAALVFAAFAPAMPALAWSYTADCAQIEGIDTGVVEGTISFPLNSPAFYVQLQQLVDGEWVDVVGSRDWIFPSMDDSPAEFRLNTLGVARLPVMPEATALRVRNSVTNEFSAAFRVCDLISD